MTMCVWHCVAGKLVCVLWNVEQFYGQFVSHVRADIESGRKPLETELKVRYLLFQHRLGKMNDGLTVR